MAPLPEVARFDSSLGHRVYRLPCEAFPEFIAYAYLVLGAGPPTLVDAGSGYGDSTRHLLAGLETVRTRHGEAIHVHDVERILITHGHIDHFGGLPQLLPHTRAKIGVHPLDRRVLAAFEERVVVATKALGQFLAQAGVSDAERHALLSFYTYSKKHVHSLPVDLLLDESQPLDGMEFVHVPGHCPGQVAIVLGDLLLSADHVLARTTPHLAPESVTAHTGLSHYLASLDKIGKLPGVRLALGGHEAPIPDFYDRVARIQASHARKLETILGLLAESAHPLTVAEIASRMYPKAQDFHRLLALEEVGAHVEHLDQYGRLAVANLDEVERDANPPLRYAPV